MLSLPLHLFEPILTTAAMRSADRRTIDELGVPGRLLMESAGRATANVIERELGEAAGRRVLILCGKGNNGGDGLVVARVLHARGAVVRVVVLGDENDLAPDAASNLRLLARIAEKDDGVEITTTTDAASLDRYWPEWIVDALLGIGVTEPLRAPIVEFAAFINSCPAPCVALDIPSGLDSDTGEAFENAVQADLTVTMAASKAGLLFRDGPRHAGEVHNVEIGIPGHLLNETARESGAGWMCTDAATKKLLPARPHRAHKYTAGRVLIVAGSRAFPGAAALAAEAAARAGAGAVVVATTGSARSFLENRLSEVMSLALDETPDGTIAGSTLEVLLERANSSDAVLIGPGLGGHPETQALVRKLVAGIEKPLVIDADGLNALAGHDDVFTSSTADRWVLTPHHGEMRRLANGEIGDESRPYEVAQNWAKRFGCTLLLKGAPSVVSSQDGTLFLSGAHTPALATAGTGDVLAGITASLLAQGLDGPAAAIVALHLSGRAAQRNASTHAPRTMLAGDIIRELPNVFPA